MKAICIISHREHIAGGGYKEYEAAREYEIESPDPAYFNVSEAKRIPQRLRVSAVNKEV